MTLPLWWLREEIKATGGTSNCESTAKFGVW